MATKTRTPANGAKTVAVPFPVSPKSPFSDGYDIEGERIALKDLIQAEDFDKVVLDQRYQRYLELERREESLRQAKAQHAHRGGADPEVPIEEANAVNFHLGQLTDEEQDTMALHTRESSRLFMGRVVEPGKQGYGQSGAKKVGAALRAIWYLSGNDNPYADFALIEASSRITELAIELETAITEMESKLDQLKRRGLTYSVVRADPPATVNLGFRSPYGYSVVRLVSTFDYFVRVVKTLVRKDLMSDRDGYSTIFERTRACRSVFERVIYFQRYLMREALRPLSRADWLPVADEEAKKRVTAAVALFGELPREVFNGQLMPRHSRRRLDLSEEELRLLDAVPLAGADAQLEAATEALV